VIELLKSGERIEGLSEHALYTYLRVIHQGINGNKQNAFHILPLLSNLLIIARSFLSSDLKRESISIIVEVGGFYKLPDEIKLNLRNLLIQTFNCLPSLIPLTSVKLGNLKECAVIIHKLCESKKSLQSQAA
jgi:hypothetical protein